MEINKVNRCGMELEEVQHKSCVAEIGVGKGWATVYLIESEEQGKGHASELLLEAKKHYESIGKKFGSSVALNDRMRKLLQKLKIREYDFPFSKVGS